RHARPRRARADHVGSDFGLREPAVLDRDRTDQVCAGGPERPAAARIWALDREILQRNAMMRPAPVIRPLSSRLAADEEGSPSRRWSRRTRLVCRARYW